MGIVIEQLDLRRDVKVYELSAHGALFKYLRKNFIHLTCSEYFDGVAPGTIHQGLRCEDVQQLTFGDNNFDLITSTEVFEHVADDRKGFSEVFRVLKPGGHFVFTVPMKDQPRTLERAIMKDGDIIHLETPQYGNDRIRKTVLDFRDYGWDITDRLRIAGFQHAEVLRITNDQWRVPEKFVVLARRSY
jgi:SAM-dependent methyltransferase